MTFSYFYIELLITFYWFVRTLWVVNKLFIICTVNIFLFKTLLLFIFFNKDFFFFYGSGLLCCLLEDFLKLLLVIICLEKALELFINLISVYFFFLLKKGLFLLISSPVGNSFFLTLILMHVGLS